MSATALTVGGMAVGGITSLVGNSMSLKASYAEASYMREYGDMQYYDALMEAKQTETEARQYKENQAMKYVMSGVSLRGTPMQALDYTSAQSQLEINQLKSRGQKLRELQYIKAQNLESSARGKMLTGLATSAFQLGSGLKTASEGGMFYHAEPDWNSISSNLNSISQYGGGFGDPGSYGF